MARHSSFIASLVFAVFIAATGCGSPKVASAAPSALKGLTVAAIDTQANEWCTKPGLLKVAEAAPFRKATMEDRIATVEEWVGDNLKKETQDWSLLEKETLAYLLAKYLDDLLAEKEFGKG